MLGGDEAAFERVAPVMDCYAKAMTLIGPAGSGQMAKMVNQICIAGIVQGIAEGLHFAKRANIDPAKVMAAISKGAAQSWQMENRYVFDGKVGLQKESDTPNPLGVYGKSKLEGEKAIMSFASKWCIARTSTPF